MPIGVTVRSRTAPPSGGPSIDTGTLFITGKASTGSLTSATLVRSLADYEAAYGPRDATNAPTYDSLDAFFREGGGRAYVARYNDTGTVTAGLALFPKGLGPGQVMQVDTAPGAAVYGQLLDHAAANNRVALLNVGNGDTVTAMTTLGNAIPSSNRTYGALFGPWVNIPAPAGVLGGATRQVPASAIVAALIARADALGNPNRAAAGRDFPLQYALGYTRDITDTERETLLNAGVNTFATIYNVLELYGFQTGAPQSPDDPYWQFNCSRTRMWMVAQCQKVGENYMFRPIDGRGILAGSLKSDIDGVMLGLFNANALYGDTPEAAWSVNVGVAVNTTATVAQGELHAAVEARLSLHAKQVIIDLVTIPVTGRVSVS